MAWHRAAQHWEYHDFLWFPVGKWLFYNVFSTLSFKTYHFPVCFRHDGIPLLLLLGCFFAPLSQSVRLGMLAKMLLLRDFGKTVWGVLKMRPPNIGLAAVLLVWLALGGRRLLLKLGVWDMCAQKHIIKLTHFKADLWKHSINVTHCSDVWSDTILFACMLYSHVCIQRRDRWIEMPGRVSIVFDTVVCVPRMCVVLSA